MINLKNIKRIFVLFLSIFSLFTISCMQNLNESESDSSGIGTVKVGFTSKIESAARTVIPGTPEEEYEGVTYGTYSLFTNIKLYKASTTATNVFIEDRKVAEWADYEEMESNGASFELSEGDYKFGIELTSFGTVMRQTISATVVSGKTTALNFTELEKYSGDTGASSIRISVGDMTLSELVKFIGGNNTDEITISVKTSTEEEISFSLSEYSGETEKDSNGGEVYLTDQYEIVYADKALKEGSYEIIFTFKAGTSEISYPVDLIVKAGYLSYGYLSPFANIISEDIGEKTPYKLTYMSNTSESDTLSVSKTVYSESAFYLDDSELGFSNGTKRIKYWTTNQNGTGEKFNIGDVFVTEAESSEETVTEIILYAYWAELYDVNYVLEYYDPGDKSKKEYVFTQKYENSVDKILSVEEILIPGMESFGVDYFIHSATREKFTADDIDLFCGWDTKSDGTGTRYYHDETSQPSDATDQPTLKDDVTIYAQWVGSGTSHVMDETTSTNFDYAISDVSYWNALFGAEWKNSSEKNIVITKNIENPHEEFTNSSSFTFKGNLYGNSSEITITGLTAPLFYTNSGTIKSLELDGPVCQTNEGTIEEVNVLNYTSNNNTSYSDAGGIADVNGEGAVIKNCSVKNMTVTNAGTSAGGIAGTNYGTITDCTVDEITFNALATYTGGLVGLQCKGAEIEKTTSTTEKDVQNVTFEGDTTGKNYGYVFGGYNSSNNWAGTDHGVDTSITTDVKETIANASYSCECTNNTSILLKTITLERTSLVTLIVNPDNDAWYMGIMNSASNPYDTTPLVGSTSKGGTLKRTSYEYLPAGTYYLRMSEGRLLGEATGTYTVNID